MTPNPGLYHSPPPQQFVHPTMQAMTVPQQAIPGQYPAPNYVYGGNVGYGVSQPVQMPVHVQQHPQFTGQVQDLAQGGQYQPLQNQGPQVQNQSIPGQQILNQNQHMQNQQVPNQHMPNQQMPNQQMSNQQIPNQQMPNQQMLSQPNQLNQTQQYQAS